MKKYILLLTIINIILGCSASSNNPVNLKQNPEINSENIIVKVLQHVKHYPKEPRYVIYHTNGMCNFEIFVNDRKVVKSFNNESFSTGNEINPYLLDGTNTLKVVLYPREDQGKFNDQTVFDLKVESYENTDRFSVEKQQDSLFVYSNPKNKDHLFEGSGKERFEEIMNFKLAEVPYRINGWKDSQDLRDFDKKILEAKVLEAYKMIQSAFKAKDLDKIARFSYNKIKDQAISQYFDQDEVQDAWEKLTNIVHAENLTFIPIDHYELVFYGDGKLIGLKSTKREKGYREASALMYTSNKNEKLIESELDYLLHIPKGKTAFEIY